MDFIFHALVIGIRID